MVLLFYSTFPDQDIAIRIINTLIDSKLVACGNAFPIQSCYEWQSQMHQEDEWAAILKTAPHLATEVENHLQALHPYDTPCIIHWSVAANASYQAWIYAQCAPAPKP